MDNKAITTRLLKALNTAYARIMSPMQSEILTARNLAGCVFPWPWLAGLLRWPVGGAGSNIGHVTDWSNTSDIAIGQEHHNSVRNW